MLWVSVFRAFKEMGQLYNARKTPSTRRAAEWVNFYAWFRDFFGHPPKKRTPIPLADLALRRADPGAPWPYPPLVPFFALSAKRPPAQDMELIPLTPSPFLHPVKKCAKLPPGFERPSVKSPAPAEERSAPIARPLVSLPPSRSPGLYFVTLFALAVPSAASITHRLPRSCASPFTTGKNRAKIKPRREVHIPNRPLLLRHPASIEDTCKTIAIGGLAAAYAIKKKTPPISAIKRSRLPVIAGSGMATHHFFL